MRQNTTFINNHSLNICFIEFIREVIIDTSIEEYREVGGFLK
jgi:hypothetical protein